MITDKNFRTGAWLVIIVVAAISIYFMNEIRQNARMETNLDEYMPATHQAFIYSHQAEDWFNIKDGILIAIENKSGIYNPQTLESIADITLALQDMTEFDPADVMSLYSADNITGSEWGLDVRPFYRRVPATQQELADLRVQVRANQMVYRRLVSEDETVALIIAGLQSNIFSQELYHSIMEFAGSYENDQHTVYVAGRPIVEGSMAMLGPVDMKRMVPLVLATIAIVLFLLLGSLRAAGATLLSVFISTIWAFGLMSAFNVPVYSISTMIPVMLIAIGVAYGIYFYNHLNNFYLSHPRGSGTDAVRYATATLFRPLAMAAFTTMIGFLSLLSSQVFPVKYFGVFTAIGIFAAFVLAMVFLPAAVILMGYEPGKKKKKYRSWGAALSQIATCLLRNKKWVYLSVGVVVFISLLGIQRLGISSSFLRNFEKDSHIVLTDNFVNSKFGGTSTLNVILESDEADVFKQPGNLMLVDQMQTQALKLENIGNSFSLADYLKRMHMVMNEDQPGYYAIPPASDLIAQYLLLYEMSGDPANLLRVVNYNYNRLNITFQLKGDDSAIINQALEVTEAFRKPFADNGIDINYAGSGYKALVFTDLILEGQIMSIAITLFMVMILLSLMFASIKAGLIGSVPIVITALISFGVMGLMNIPLSTTTALLSSIAIGIGIDYAIHFMQNYRMNLKKDNAPRKALLATITGTGKAILFNALVVISGFLVLLVSVFPPNRTLGALVSMNMLTSLLGTLSIMMILVYVFRVFQPKIKSGDEDSSSETSYRQALPESEGVFNHR